MVGAAINIPDPCSCGNVQLNTIKYKNNLVIRCVECGTNRYFVFKHKYENLL